MKKVLLFLTGMVLLTTGIITACQPAPQAFVKPTEAVKLSEVVPRMGEHWADTKDFPLGPIYLVHDGKVIGVEYMFTPEMLTEVNVPPPVQAELGPTIRELDPLPVGGAINHMTISFMPQGHAGFTVPHFDVHLYFITPEERNKVMPAGAPPE